MTSNTGWYTDDYVVKVKDKAGNVSGSYKISYYTVSTTDGMVGIATASNNSGTFAGRTIKQTDYINFHDAAFSGISNFAGTFDGNGYVINDVKITGTAETSSGLFNNTTIRQINSTYYSASIIDVQVYGITIEKKATDVGAIVGKNTGGTINHCVVLNMDISVDGITNFGGIVGSNNQAQTSAKIYNCYTFGNMNVNDYYTFQNFGKIVGYNSGGATVEKCISEMTFDKEKIKGTGGSQPSSIGGIVGYNAGGGTVTDCANKSDVVIIGFNYVGGVVGWNGNGGVIQACYNNSQVGFSHAGSGGCVGGIAGYNDTYGMIQKVYTTGDFAGVGLYSYYISGQGSSTNPGGSYNDCYYISTGNENRSGKGTSVNSAKLKVLPALNGLNGFFKIDIDNNNKGYPLLKWEEGSEPSTSCLYYSKTSPYNVTVSNTSMKCSGNNVYIYVPSQNTTMTFSGSVGGGSISYILGNTNTSKTCVSGLSGSGSFSTPKSYPSFIECSGQFTLNYPSRTMVELP